MAQKAAKSLATRNAAKLRQTHLITAILHAIFIFFAFTLRRSSITLVPYALLSLPALALEFYLDRLGRPQYTPDGLSLKRSGEDLDAKGLTEFFWDVIYWTWINLIVVVLFGNKAWWAYLVVPAYTVYAVIGTAKGVKGMLSGGFAGAGGEGEGSATGTPSKRQAKMEKRGGEQRVKYR